ncbi:hypothetical protein FRB94_007181 [Tulasnella sp. JGI-2019a]|nr:hypothetical protein FRB94_007181 [Tulasnella sp. JGI-2019a]
MRISPFIRSSHRPDLSKYTTLSHHMHPSLVHYFSLLLVGNSLLAKASPIAPPTNAGTELIWGLCPIYNDTVLANDPFPVVCANFSVPVDWRDPSSNNITLIVGKIAATTNSSLGAVYINPGGPGQSGVDLLQSQLIMDIYNSTGGAFDLISWDPRGIAFSSAFIDCFDPAGESFTFDSWAANLTTLGGLQAPASGPSKKDINTFLGNVEPWRKVVNTFTDKCNQQNAAHLTQVGTVATVQDMVAIADAITGPGNLINYYGYSYGTILGAYFINLFPERVGRVVVDGVVNVTMSSSLKAYEFFASSISDGDKALQGFLTQCAEAGPSGCALASSNSTQASLNAWVDQLINDAYNFAPLGSGITSWDVRTLLESTARAPSEWQSMAGVILQVRQAIDTLISSSNATSTSGGNSTVSATKRSDGSNYVPLRRSLSTLAKRGQTAAQSNDNNWSSAVTVLCGDTSAPSYSASEAFSEIVNMTQSVSSVFGPFIAEQPEAICGLWPYRAVQRYAGPWDAKTIANPIVVVGTTADPVTPLHMAKELVRTLNSHQKRNAALIQTDGFGHTSASEPSFCKQALLRGYFMNGTLPADILCGINFLPFPNGTAVVPTQVISTPLQWT